LSFLASHLSHHLEAADDQRPLSWRRALVEWFFVLTATAYNLIRIPKILAATL
jgi:hypothetical protein